MRNEKGQAAIEFALALPIIIFLLFGIVDFGKMLYTANTLNMLSQQAARIVSLEDVDTLTDEEVEDLVLDADNTHVSIDVSPDTRDRGDYATVVVTYDDVQYITPLISNIMPESISSTSVIRIE
ncbi:MAG: TadE/TadG family type IV pilus assembly protein [Clostridiaceae bacterium]